MSAFTGELTVTELAVNWRLWRLEQALVYEIGALGSGKSIEVPVKFVTDGTTVPRILWSFLPTWGSYSRAAVVHDYLCNRLNSGIPHPLVPDRRRADAVFYEAMKVCGTSLPVRFVMWAAVRLYAIWKGLDHS